MSGDDKLLPDMDLGDVKTEKIPKGLADVPAEDLGESDSENETETEIETTDSDSDSEYECKICDKKFPDYMQFKQHKKGKKHAKMVSKKKLERKLRGKRDESVEGKHDDEHLIPDPYSSCKVCDKEFFGPESYQMHLRSKNHKHKVLEASILEQVREKGEINADKLKELYNKSKRATDDDDAEGHISSLKKNYASETTHEEFECKECEKVFSGLTPFTQHLISKTHAKKIEKKKIIHDVLREPSDGNVTSDTTKDLSTLSLEDDVLVCKLCSTSFSGPESAMMHLKSKNHAKKLDRHIRKMKRKNKKKEARGCSGSDDEVEVQPEKEAQEELEEHRPISEPSSTTDAAQNVPIAEAQLPTTADKFEEHGLYEKYKNYKELMNALPRDDVILK